MDNRWRRYVALFLVSQTVSLFGSSIVQYAIAWHITLETGSGLMVTLSIICGFLPAFFLSPFAGVWADRVNKRLLVAVSDAAIALVTLVLAVVFASGSGKIWMLFAALAIRALGSGMHGPAVNALLPQLVPRDRLVRINGINASIQYAVNLISPLASGALLALSGIGRVFMIDVFTAAAAVALLLFFVKAPEGACRSTGDADKKGYFEDMARGFAYIGKHVLIKRIFLFCGLFFFFITPAAFLTALQVARNFGGGVWHLSVMEAAFSAGTISGGLIVALRSEFRDKGAAAVYSSALIAAISVALGAVKSFYIYVALICIMGISLPVFNTMVNVMLQEKSGEEFRGRVFGVFNMLSSSVMPIGMLVFGPLADLVDINAILVAGGALALMQCAIFARRRVLSERPRW